MKATIIELVFLAILVICAWNGYKKGLIMGVGGILVIVVSLYGATLLSNTFSYEVIPALRPFAGGYIEGKAPKVLYDMLGYEADENGDYNVVLSVDDLLDGDNELTEQLCVGVYKSLGIYTSTAEILGHEAVEYAKDNGVGIIEAMTETACLRLTYAAGVIMAFLLLAIALTVIGNIPNFSFKIPYMGLFNDITGTLTGIITGIMLCAVLIWALKFLGMALPEEIVADTRVAGWFLKKDLLLRYLGL